MVSHTMGRGLRIEFAIIIVATIIVVGMLAGFAGPVAATTGLFGFSGVGAAMLVPPSIQDPAQDQ